MELTAICRELSPWVVFGCSVMVRSGEPWALLLGGISALGHAESD